MSADTIARQGQEIYTSVRSLTHRYLVAFSTSSVHSERLLKRLGLNTSEIRRSQTKIKELIELLSVLDGKTRARESSGLSMSVQAWAPGRQKGTYSITRGSGALRAACKETGRPYSGTLLTLGGPACRVTKSSHFRSEYIRFKLFFFFIPSSYCPTRNPRFCSS